MPNTNYLRGRRWEWAVQKQFKNQGHVAMRTAGSHGVADLIVCPAPAKDGSLAFTTPLTIAHIEETLEGWLKVHDPKKILHPYLFGFQKHLPKGGTVTIHASPVSCWMIQLKHTKGK